MKTTVELPDDLAIAVKKAAAERRTTIRDLVEHGLRRELEAGKPAGGARRIRWITVDGGLPVGADVRDRQRLHEWLRTERSADRP